jgi:uncharacterized protein
MLGLNLARIKGPREHFARVYEAGEFAPEAGVYRVVAPVSLGMDVFKDQNRFRLTGSTTTRLELPCSRCLEPFEWQVDAAFDLQYQPRSAATANRRDREIGDEDGADAYYDEETIDLGQLMTEQFYLSIPMKPLCQDACRGLCPECGTNLNRGTCTCARDWVDPRLAVLRTLKGK